MKFLLLLCKGSGVEVWVEEASLGAIQGAMTDGLTEVIGVSCKLLLSDGVDADPDQSFTWAGYRVESRLREVD